MLDLQPILDSLGITFEPISHKYYRTRIVDNGAGKIVTNIASVNQMIDKVMGNPFAQDNIYMRRARDKGTLIHNTISDFIKFGKAPSFPMAEFDNFLKLSNSRNIVWVLSEQIIYNEINGMPYCGTLDLYSLLCEEITDIKTGSTKQLKKWQIQLSLYAQALRDMFGLKVTKGSVLWLHDEISEYIPITLLTKAELVLFLNKYYNDDTSDKEQEMTLKCLNANAIQELNETLTAIEVMEEKVKSIKAKIKEEMEQRNINQIRLGKRVISYVAPIERETVDIKKLKDNHPAIWAECRKISKVGSSIRIK